MLEKDYCTCDALFIATWNPYLVPTICKLLLYYQQDLVDSTTKTNGYYGQIDAHPQHPPHPPEQLPSQLPLPPPFLKKRTYMACAATRRRNRRSMMLCVFIKSVLLQMLPTMLWRTGRQGLSLPTYCPVRGVSLPWRLCMECRAGRIPSWRMPWRW